MNMKLKPRWQAPASAGAPASPEDLLPAPQLAGELNDWIDQARAARMAQGSWHECAVTVRLDLERVQRRLAEHIVHTRAEEGDEGAAWFQLLLELSPGCLASIRRNHLQVFATDPATARDVAEGLRCKFLAPSEPEKPSFQLIKKGCGIESISIPLQRGEASSDGQLALHYGPDFPSWNTRLLAALRGRPTGMIVLEGPPGTGKTSYIRHLMATLKDTHRFYFIPASNLEVLKDPEFVEFWSDERTLHPSSQLVVVLEDAEEALLPRTGGSRAEVGALLNITDGLLGDFLRLHIIGTINCPVDRLDPALLRPGRLVARWHFGRLPRERAEAVAAHLGTALPPDGGDYSLAEIFAGAREPAQGPARLVGFER